MRAAPDSPPALRSARMTLDAPRPLGFPRTTRGSVIAAPSRPIRDVLDEFSIVPRKRHGQNFLHDPAVAARIAGAAALASEELVLEIGPGLGALTRPMLETGARVTAIEIDPRIVSHLEAEFADVSRFTLHAGDALALDWNEVAAEPFVLVSNLPYSITGPLLDRILRAAPHIRRAVVMVQKEVAARLAAGAGGKTIGAPGVLMRILFDVERLFDVGSGAFRPAPDVTSTVLRLSPRAGAVLATSVRETVNRAYLHRRKMIKKTLAAPGVVNEATIAGILESMGRPANARPEELEPDEWPSLVAAIESAGRS